MKNFTKACLIAGGVCILIGGGITTVAAAMGGRLSDVSACLLYTSSKACWHPRCRNIGIPVILNR